jgi:hypothetical protein
MTACCLAFCSDASMRITFLEEFHVSLAQILSKLIPGANHQR